MVFIFWNYNAISYNMTVLWQKSAGLVNDTFLKLDPGNKFQSRFKKSLSENHF
jgi:hypothetical protein